MSADLKFLQLEPKTSLDKTWGGNCFACSPTNNHGLKLKFVHVPGYCYARYSIPSDYCGFDTMAHGGIIATLLDEASGWTIMTNLFKFAFTVEANIKFLRPVPLNTELIIVGQILSQEGQNLTLKASIISLNGLVLAEMASKWFSPNREQATKITGRNAEALEDYSKKAFSKIRGAIGVVEKSP